MHPLLQLLLHIISIHLNLIPKTTTTNSVHPHHLLHLHHIVLHIMHHLLELLHLQHHP